MMLINPLGDTYPYIGLFVVILLVAIVMFWKYPQLRICRRRRNLLIYVTLIVLLSLVAYQAYTLSLGPNYVSFSIEKTHTPILSAQQNMFSITCTSEGAKDIQFYMIIKCSNATLQADLQQGYLQLNSTAIKIPFSFHGDGKQTKSVYFIADENVGGLSFYPFVERINDSPMVVWVYLSEIQCTYSLDTHSFAMADSMPMPVP